MRTMRTMRWWPLAAALLAAGAVLLMHGLDAHAGGIETSAAHHDVDDAGHHDGLGCPDCRATHLLVACVAVTGLAGAAVLARRTPRPASPVPPGRGSPIRAPHAGPPRPPGWVDLSVMRC